MVNDVTMISPIEVRDWEKAQAEYVNPAGDNAAERSASATAAIHRMTEIETRWESAPGGFHGEHERYHQRLKQVVDSFPPLTFAQRNTLYLLLHPGG